MADEFSLVCLGEHEKSKYASLLITALSRSLALDHKLPKFIFDMEGMSGRKYRSFVNNLAASISDARYLEVGSWAGSTACAAMHGNSIRVTCIDNWSQFGGPRDAFRHNTNLCLDERVEFTFIESDFRKVDFGSIGLFNIYLFDGPHEAEDQRDGITMALPALDPEFFFFVDDWNWQGVREGTMDGIALAGLEVVYGVEIRTTQDDGYPSVTQQDSDWHNGYFLCVLRRA